MTKLTRKILCVLMACALMSSMALCALAATDFDSKMHATYVFISGTVTQESNDTINTVTRVKVNPNDSYLWTACIQKNGAYIGTQLYDESEVGALSFSRDFGILQKIDFTPTRVECMHAAQQGNGIAYYAETGIDLENMDMIS